jgi:hypothetical protein
VKALEPENEPVPEPIPKPIPEPKILPRLVVRLAGRLVTIVERAGVESEIGGEDGTDDEKEGGKGEDDEGVEGDGEDLLQRIEREIKDCEEKDSEDAPDWEFEDGETKSPDKNYVFCPAQHRGQVLRLFTRHFVRHPIFPARSTSTFDNPSEIRLKAVKEMYSHCRTRGLTEVWAYLWTQWYSPKHWPLWARSTSNHLSRLRTTMTVENHWKQLKRTYLHFMHRPRLDHAVYVLCSVVIPAYMLTASSLEDLHRMGRGKQLTPFQRSLKKSWKLKAAAKVSGNTYITDVKNWQCTCGGQELDSHHLCKHLVQAAAPPAPRFFSKVVRRRTAPLYRHPMLHGLDQEDGRYADADEGCITDGDDHEGIGGHGVLKMAERDGEVGGWRDVLTGVARESMLKRKRSDTMDDGVSEGERGGRDGVRTCSGLDVEYRAPADEEEEEVRNGSC